MKKPVTKEDPTLENFPFGRKEGIDLEFKEATHALPKNLFETICAFLNMDGGLVVLGVADDGTVTGVAPEMVDRLCVEIANLSNNPSKLDPPNLLFPQAEEISRKWVIKIQVPTSSQVHQTGGHVYLRSNQGDYRITGLNHVTGLVNRKLGMFSEQRVVPHLRMADLMPGLFKRARVLMKANNPPHPWLKLPAEKMLMLAGFIRKDRATGRIGYTLAAALMFGKDTTIQQAAPGFKFDAILRRHDVDRYDDRLIVSTNLIDSYDLLMGFVEKHLNDPFYLEGHERISLRSRIFRELVANLIAHREYTSPAPATMTIYKDRVEFKNPNIPHYWGQIDPDHFTPFAKNPTICNFLRQMGRYEELGSGVRNVTKYHPFYAPGAAAPTFTDENMFSVTVPLGMATQQDTPQDTPQVTPQVVTILDRAQQAVSAGDLQAATGLKDRVHFLKSYLEPCLTAGLLERTIPDKPRSSRQKYRLTDKGRAILSSVE
jgi:ATP-dependent DNA helicase RecG